MAFSETWLSSKDTDTDLSINGFGAPVRLDRDAEATGKSQGGGVCVYINQRWCSNITVREKICTPGIELLSISVRPFYLPREFPQIFVTVIYIHPKANTQTAADTIRKVTQRLQSLSPDAPCLLMGDFNNCKLSKTLNFYQYVTCPTRKNKTLDKCYGSIKEAYKASPLAPIGSSDHCTINLIPVYRPMLKRGEVKTREIETWEDESVLKLQGCFNCTDWSVFIDSASDIDELVDAVCCYISFCVDFIIPKKYVKVYANNKP